MSWSDGGNEGLLDRGGRGGAIHCRSGLLVGQKATLSVDPPPDGSLYVDFKIGLGPSKQGYDVTGRTWCTFSGTVQGGKLECQHIEKKNVAPPAPSIAPFNPAVATNRAQPGETKGSRADLNLLNLLAWCVTAAGVGGVLIVGSDLALQLRRGEIGFGAVTMKRAFLILTACFLSMTAGPIIQFLNIPLP
ncbi:hypothetical protein [Actinoplanes sp. NPDC048796]|uniref:hypothetical protein n=1 Tax=Actinoplanes sp. NPDC048796 TaxID=3155640 RepID=UPI0033C350AC